MSAETIKLIHDAMLASRTVDLRPVIAQDFDADLDLSVEVGSDDAQPLHSVIWEIVGSGAMRLTVSRKLLATPRVGYVATRITRILPLIVAYQAAKLATPGRVSIDVEDFSDGGGLTFCSRQDDAFLIPDTDFLAALGYASYRKAVARGLPAWMDRDPRALWRGSTTGLIWAVSNWRELPRLKLSLIARPLPELFDVGVSNVVQIENFAADIEAAGLIRPPVPALQWGHYRYQIDVDGNSNAWAGYYQRLLTGSPVLKVASPHGFRQWFYRSLEPWVHYVPVAADMSDLVEKVEWLNRHLRVAKLIGIEGRRAAYAMTYESEISKAILTMSSAMHGRKT